MFNLSLLQLDQASTQNEIDAVLDQPTFLSIVNQSSWGHVQAVTMSSKHSFLQLLIWDEVIQHRLVNIHALMKGLNCLGYLQLVKDHADQLINLFVHKAGPLTAAQLLAFLKPSITGTEEKRQALQFFKDFILYLESKALFLCPAAGDHCAWSVC